MKISQIAKALVLAVISSFLVLVAPGQVASATSVSIDLEVAGPNGEDLNGYSIYVYDPEFNEAAFITASTEVEGLQTLTLDPGQYSVELYPFDSVAGTTNQHQTIAPSMFSLVITSSAEISLERNQAGTLTAVSPTDGVFTLEAAVASIHGRLLGPDAQPIPISEDSNVTVILESWDGSFFMQGEGAVYDFLKPDGSFALEIPATGEYRLWFVPYGLSEYAASYAPSFSFTAGTGPIDVGDFQVATANLSGRVLGPTDSSPVPFMNVSVLDQATGFQSNGLFGFTNEEGVWGINVSTDGAYLLVAEPYDIPGLAKSEAISFSVVAGTITVEGDLDPMALDLQLREPNVVVEVRATVSGVSVAVDEVWVNLSSFSNNVGGQTLPNGNAEFFLDSTSSDWAVFVWIGGNPAFSTDFMNFDGTITSDMFRDVDGKSVVTLYLDRPNLRFSLEKGAPGSETTLKYASVVVTLGNWFGFGFSDENGEVIMNIDTAAIATANAGLSGTHSLSFTIYPPYGESDVQVYECETGVGQPLFCGDIPSVTIGQPYSQTFIADPYLMPPPNTLILVKGPNGEAIGAGAWVTLLVDTDIPNCSGCYEYVGGGATDANGYAGLTVDTSSYTVSFSIEIQPPWDTQLEVAASSHFVADYAGLSSPSGFSLAAPNLTLVIQEPDNSPSKWSYAIAEEVDPSTGGFIDWIGGSGSSEEGFIKLSLPANSSVSLTVFPGPFSGAATTKCVVSVDSSEVVSLADCSTGAISQDEITLTLSSGNVLGVVSHGGNPIAGALVVASNGASTISAVTDATGNYGLQLEFPNTWTIEVFYASDDASVPGYLNGGSVTAAGTKNLAL